MGSSVTTIVSRRFGAAWPLAIGRRPLGLVAAYIGIWSCRNRVQRTITTFVAGVIGRLCEALSLCHARGCVDRVGFILGFTHSRYS
jgi:hypothetical protein